MIERGFRDRDFLSTKEGFLFCVVGPHHPPSRVISYVKYIPDTKGIWQSEKEKFKRLMRKYTITNLLDTISFLKKTYPQYLFNSDVYNITISAVQHNQIKEHFKPESKLHELHKKKNIDTLQEKVVQLTTLLSEQSGVSIEQFGITGSILLGIHNPVYSDIDITVYGIENSFQTKNALTEMVKTRLGIKKFDESNKIKWLRRKTQKHNLKLVDAQNIFERKWNIGTFKGTSFSVHPVKTEDELTEKYGDKKYFPIGTITLQGVVTETKESIFLPSIYKIDKVNFETFNAPTDGKDIEEVVSYESLYDNIAEKGDTIVVRGKLENVVDNRTRREYKRVLVGSLEGKGQEFIKLLKYINS